MSEPIGPVTLGDVDDLGAQKKTLMPLVDRQPGKLNISGELRASYTGCATKMFREINGPLDEQLNKWAETWEFTYTIVGIHLAPPFLMVVYTCMLEEEDITELQEHQEEVEAILREKRQARAEKRRVEEEEAKKVWEEEAELIRVGKRCRDNHGHIIKQLREEADK